MKIIDISNCSDGVIAYINNLQKYIDKKEKEIQDLKQKNDYLNDLEASAVEYKELQKERDMYKSSFETMTENYFKLENIIKEVREYIEHENFKRNILVGVSTKKYTRDILNKILEILDKASDD